MNLEAAVLQALGRVTTPELAWTPWSEYDFVGAPPKQMLAYRGMGGPRALVFAHSSRDGVWAWCRGRVFATGEWVVPGRDGNALVALGYEPHHDSTMVNRYEVAPVSRDQMDQLIAQDGLL